jgi:alpha-tubulin suppressor-like RCC1 family protein
LALDASGQVWAWGQNTYGELVLGTTTNQSHACKVEFAGQTRIVAIGAGYYITGTVHKDPGTSFAIADDGTIYAWGYNADGELGLSGTDNVLTPTVTGSSI